MVESRGGDSMNWSTRAAVGENSWAAEVIVAPDTAWSRVGACSAEVAAIVEDSTAIARVGANNCTAEAIAAPTTVTAPTEIVGAVRAVVLEIETPVTDCAAGPPGWMAMVTAVHPALTPPASNALGFS